MNGEAKDRVVVSPRRDGALVAAGGAVVRPPIDWELLPPGDAALSRRVAAEGPHWVVEEKKGRRVFRRGVWAPAERIARLRAELLQERQDPAHGRRLAQGRARRARAQADYVEDFTAAVRQFLAFAPAHGELERRLAAAIAAHATPVGSGTVARTARIPVAERAAAATIAWLRHRTTGYDHMAIPRVRGRRREVRRLLAARSREMLDGYRRGLAPDPTCPLRMALDGGATTAAGP